MAPDGGSSGNIDFPVSSEIFWATSLCVFEQWFLNFYWSKAPLKAHGHKHKILHRMPEVFIYLWFLVESQEWTECVSTPNSYVKALTLIVSIFGDRA